MRENESRFKNLHTATLLMVPPFFMLKFAMKK